MSEDRLSLVKTLFPNGSYEENGAEHASDLSAQVGPISASATDIDMFGRQGNVPSCVEKRSAGVADCGRYAALMWLSTVEVVEWEAW